MSLVNEAKLATAEQLREWIASITHHKRNLEEIIPRAEDDDYRTFLEGCLDSIRDELSVIKSELKKRI